jgi:hypothetical protein
MYELQELLDTDEDGVNAFLNSDNVEKENTEPNEFKDEENQDSKNEGEGENKDMNENYNASELTDVLILIKNGQIKKVFEEIKTKDNVTFLDVAKVLVEKNKPEYLIRLLEMAVYNGYLKI